MKVGYWVTTRGNRIVVLDSQNRQVWDAPRRPSDYLEAVRKARTWNTQASGRTS